VSTLNYIIHKYNLSPQGRLPVEIPNIGRNDLALLFTELGFRVGAEIGVQQGEYTEVLCKAGLKVYGVDPWQRYSGYREHVSQAKLDRFYKEAKARLAPYDCELIQEYSRDAVLRFENRSLDFVFIDGNHDFQNVTNDIAEWSRKVREGGIVSGHDYIKRNQPTGTHVVQVVQAYTYALKIDPWFVLGRKEKQAGETRDQSRSWMWVKDS
jgi:SAM-dependent methyltransferase